MLALRPSGAGYAGRFEVGAISRADAKMRGSRRRRPRCAPALPQTDASVPPARRRASPGGHAGPAQERYADAIAVARRTNGVATRMYAPELPKIGDQGAAIEMEGSMNGTEDRTFAAGGLDVCPLRWTPSPRRSTRRFAGSRVPG